MTHEGIRIEKKLERGKGFRYGAHEIEDEHLLSGVNTPRKKPQLRNSSGMSAAVQENKKSFCLSTRYSKCNNIIKSIYQHRVEMASDVGDMLNNPWSVKAKATLNSYKFK